MDKRKQGKHITEMACAQANVPLVIFNAVRKHAESEGFNMATFWRRYIIEGYKRDQERGLIKWTIFKKDF